ncbi:hypothetical protein [Flavobacterium sp.]|uniref:hypothetical protein n=1 Tax=Flavobacterium sp. TaxID=239 RepID=UPI002CC653E8|nr:hypothetical protein [Flavobacterium sp.]HQA75119.1 hypothetical protein [Flavobacterium sp.]
MQLLVPFFIILIPLFFLLVRLRIKRENKVSIFKLALIPSILFYLLIIVFVIFLKIQHKSELDVFDLNNDGFFSKNEINTKQRLAMKNVISDTRITFAPIIGLLYTLIFYILLLPILFLIEKISIKINLSSVN